jgi:arginine-tRNA-protein transferase
VSNPGDPLRHSGLSLYITGGHPCSYLPGLSARTLFLDPLATVDSTLYELLLQQGFRRSGRHIYRPECDGCQRCVPVRLPVRAFIPNRSQRRNRARNRPDVALVERPALFDAEHYAVYASYVKSRHAEGSMAESASPESYEDFLIAPWGGETRLLELRLEGRLMAVAVTDRLQRALSAVYTFFDPGLSHRSPGTYALLCQIHLARRLGLDHLYLGYWIEECRKMSYKDGFRPLQAWIGRRWQTFDRGEPIPWRHGG